MRFFEYLYYRTYYLYKNKWNEEDPKLYAVGLTSLMQEFNLGVILFFVISYFNTSIERIYVFLFYVVLFLMNMLLYTRRKYENIAARWDNEAKIKRIYKGILLLLYIGVSTILFFGVAVVLGKMKQ